MERSISIINIESLRQLTDLYSGASDNAVQDTVYVIVLRQDLFAQCAESEIETIVAKLVARNELLILVADCKATKGIEKIALGFDFCLTTVEEDVGYRFINQQIDINAVEKGVRAFLDRIFAEKQGRTIETIIALFKKYRRYAAGVPGGGEEADEQAFFSLISEK